MKSSLFLLFLVFSPSWVLARNSPDSSPSPSPVATEQPELPSPSPSPAAAEQPELPSPSQAPYIPIYSLEPPSPSPAPYFPQYPNYQPSPSPYEAPLSSPEPPSTYAPQYPNQPSPSPSPSHDDHHHHHHHHHHAEQPPLQGSTPLSHCWAPIIYTTGCVDDIKMAYHGVKYNVAPKCCHAIKKTSEECLFNMLYYRTHNVFFHLWLKEHCAHV